MPPAASVVVPTAAVQTGPAGDEMETRRLRVGVLLVLVACLFFALADAATKALTADYHVVQILWFRFVVFAALGLALARARLGPRLLVTRAPALQVGRGLALLANNAAVFVGFSLIPLADAHAVLAVGPLLVTALSVLFLGETVGVRRWTAVAVGFLGVMVILRPGLGAFEPGALIVLGGAAMFALYQVLTRRVVAVDDASTSIAYAAVIGLIGASLPLPLVWVTPTAVADWGLFAVAAVLAGAAHAMFVQALRLAPASAVQPFIYTILAWSVPLGWVAFGQIPDAPTLIGAAIVVASGLYALHRERVRTSQDG